MDNNRQKRPAKAPFLMDVLRGVELIQTITLSVRKNRVLRTWRAKRTEFTGRGLTTAFLSPKEKNV